MATIPQGVGNAQTTVGLNTAAILSFSNTFTNDQRFPMFLMVVARRTSGATIGDTWSWFYRGFFDESGAAAQRAIELNYGNGDNSLSDCAISTVYTAGGSGDIGINVTGPIGVTGNATWACYMQGTTEENFSSLGYSGGGGQLKRFIGDGANGRRCDVDRRNMDRRQHHQRRHE